MGVGGKLIELIKNRATDLGAEKLYISISCSENTAYVILVCTFLKISIFILIHVSAKIVI